MKPPMPRGASFEAWVEWYEAAADEPFRVEEGEEIVFHPEFGFMTWGHSIKRRALMIGKMAGDGKFWEGYANTLAKNLGYDKALWFTKRDPKAFIRRYGGRIYGYYIEREVR